MNTIRRHRRRAALRRFRRRISSPAAARFITYHAGRVVVPDYVPDAWLGEPTMNYAVVPCAAADPWHGQPLRWGWR